MSGYPPIDAATIATAARMLESGRLVAFPTETVYGLGADALNPDAVAQIFALKGRPADRPLSINVSKETDLTGWVSEIPPVARQLIDAFWPGPLTLVLKKGSCVPDTISRGKDSVALRCPAHPVAIALLKAFRQGRGGIAAPSANRSGHISPTTAQHVFDEFGDDPRLGMVLDGGPCDLGIESTILDLSHLETDGLTVLRLGAVSAQQIAAVIGRMPRIQSLTGEGQAEGEGHYVPQTPAVVLSTPEIQQAAESGLLRDAALLVHSEALSGFRGLVYAIWPLDDDPIRFARSFYAALRQADGCGARLIVLEAVPADDPWQVVADRLGSVAQGGNRLRGMLGLG